MRGMEWEGTGRDGIRWINTKTVTNTAHQHQQQAHAFSKSLTPHRSSHLAGASSFSPAPGPAPLQSPVTETLAAAPSSAGTPGRYTRTPARAFPGGVSPGIGLKVPGADTTGRRPVGALATLLDALRVGEWVGFVSGVPKMPLRDRRNAPPSHLIPRPRYAHPTPQRTALSPDSQTTLPHHGTGIGSLHGRRGHAPPELPRSKLLRESSSARVQRGHLVLEALPVLEVATVQADHLMRGAMQLDHPCAASPLVQSVHVLRYGACDPSDGFQLGQGTVADVGGRACMGNSDLSVVA